MLKSIGSNMTTITTDPHRTVLFSYSTPVAAEIDGELFRTEKKWSPTTSRHINKWLDGRNVESRPQEFFDNLLTSIEMDIA